jgi:hypothetical protein
MNPRPKRVPRLWCALQGLLPIEGCLAAQPVELAWPSDSAAGSFVTAGKRRNRVAESSGNMKRERRGTLRNQS